MDNIIPIEDLYAQPVVQQLLSKLEEMKCKADLSNMPDLDEVKLPFVMQNKILMSPGVWNNYFYSADAIKEAFMKSQWDQKEVRSLFLDHVDKSAREWVGEVRNARLDGENVVGDLVIVDKPTAQKLAYGAKFGISPKVHGMEEEQRMVNFLFDNFSVVINPAVKNAYINNSQVMAVPETDITGKFNMPNDRKPEQIIATHDPMKKTEATYSAAGSRGEMASYPGSPTPPLPPALKAGEQPKKPGQVTQTYEENKQFYPIDVSGKGYMSPSEAERKVGALPGTMASYPDNMPILPPKEPEKPEAVSQEYAQDNLVQLAEAFLRSHPNPNDSLVHQFAASRGIEPDKFEEAIYRVATMKVSDKPTNIKQGVDVSMAAIESISREQAKAVYDKLGIPGEIPPEEFYMGINVELEHGKRNPKTNVTDDDLIDTGKIAWAHLIELKDYYTRLRKMEQGKTEVKKMSNEAFEIVFNTLADMEEASIADIVKKAKASRKEGEMWADAVMRTMSVYKEPTGGDAKPKKQDGPFKAFGNPPTDAIPLTVGNKQLGEDVPAVPKSGIVPQKMDEMAVGNPGVAGSDAAPPMGNFPGPAASGIVPQAMKEQDILEQMAKLAEMLRLSRSGAMAAPSEKCAEKYPAPEPEKAESPEEEKKEEDEEKKEMRETMQKMSESMKAMEARLNEPAARMTVKTEELAQAATSRMIAENPDGALLSILQRMGGN